MCGGKIAYRGPHGFESTYKELKPRTDNRAENNLGRFESTYKELKLLLPSLVAIIVPCFESTYKELKLIERSQLFMTTRGFESTYKELKHSSNGANAFLAAFVLSLPIRN